VTLTFKEANLGNVLHSAAGLLVLLVYWNFFELSRYSLLADFRVFGIEAKRVPKPVSFMGGVNLPDMHLMGGDKVY
jgi:hypothetical protein